MPLIHFQQRFAQAVVSGTKRQTIRKARKRPIKPGDKLILAAWRGKPYRSTVRRLRVATCSSVCPITINGTRDIEINGRPANLIRVGKLAVADGFRCISEMVDWFEEVHGLPFEGVIIRW